MREIFSISAGYACIAEAKFRLLHPGIYSLKVTLYFKIPSLAAEGHRMLCPYESLLDDSTKAIEFAGGVLHPTPVVTDSRFTS